MKKQTRPIGLLTRNATRTESVSRWVTSPAIITPAMTAVENQPCSVNRARVATAEPLEVLFTALPLSTFGVIADAISLGSRTANLAIDALAAQGF